jgi:hypothetical protein
MKLWDESETSPIVSILEFHKILEIKSWIMNLSVRARLPTTDAHVREETVTLEAAVLCVDMLWNTAQWMWPRSCFVE